MFLIGTPNGVYRASYCHDSQPGAKPCDNFPPNLSPEADIGRVPNFAVDERRGDGPVRRIVINRHTANGAQCKV
jgi:hypothetical protein